MTAALKQNQRRAQGARIPSSGATPIHRVIRKGDHYICGVCRNNHSSPAAANRCLAACWRNFLAHPIAKIAKITKRTNASWLCKHCHRTYQEKKAAESCAAECQTAIKIGFYTFKVSDPSLDQATIQIARRRKISLSSVAVSQRKTQSSATDTHINQAEASTPLTASNTAIASVPSANQEKESTAQSVAPEESNAAADPANAPKPPKDRTKKFFRDGARYVCQVCNARFFTKAEVEKCWEAHP